MPKVRFVVEYDGSKFHGWQKQPGLRTIEAELERVLSMVLRERITPVYSSGRTDSGVHAKGQVVTFRVSEVPDLFVLGASVSNILRGELSVVAAEMVADGFRVREDAVSKQYTYTILFRNSPAVLDRGRVWHVTPKLNVDLMKEEAAALIGLLDFSSFRGAGCKSESPIRKIFESEVVLDGEYIYYRVVGEGFLKQMVRNIVGTLVDLGKNRLALKSIKDILAAKDRRQAGMTAPPYGLCLDWVKYAIAQ